MTLQEVNKRLLEISKELQKLIPQLIEKEWEYDKKFTQVMLASPLSSQGAREGEAKLAADTAGFYKPFIDLRADVRLLYQEKEILIEYSRNLRAIGASEKSEDNKYFP